MRIIGLGANSPSSAGYEVDNSLRFNDGSSDYLDRTPSTSGNRKTWTISVWVKRGNADDTDNYMIFQQRNNSNSSQQFLLQVRDANLRLLDQKSGSNELLLDTDRVFRDPSAWYHIVVAVDTTQSTASNRAKLYINGSITS